MARVMVVEDDEDVGDWIAYCLRQDDHEIVSVPSSELALEGLRADAAEAPDLVVLDYALPGIDGVDLLETLRGADPDLPAVFVTVQWTGKTLQRIDATGAERLAKPFEPQDLRDAVRRALAGRRSSG
ncbi:response regulator [Nocardioides ungokensis]|uniref:response regulator n=1 Tax=Nocardioides ungokensis TaxID=1643322 RepID=UPI0015DDBC72|nr:response regulator [Nocardioides ungokensis]